MLKWLVLLCLVEAIVAIPGMRTQQEIEEFKEFLYETQQDRDITLEEAMAENPAAHPWENSGKYQGDIVLRDEEIEALVNEFAANVSDFTGFNGLINTARRWPSNNVHYEIAAGFFNANHTNLIHEAAEWFALNSCVRWIRRASQANHVRISGFPTGCHTTVGFAAGVNALNVAPYGCTDPNVILHEMLHSVGFNHMHQTYNRNEWIRINIDNVRIGMDQNFNIFGANTVTMQGLPYEYGSNQHYGPYAFSGNGKPTIEPRRNDYGLMGSMQVTNLDILRLNRLYNCPGAWSMQVTADDLNKPADGSFRRRMNMAAQEEIARRNDN